MARKKKDLLCEMEGDYQPIDFYWENDRRNVYYSALVKDIVKDNRVTQRLKIFFFIIICFVLVSMCGVGAYILIRISQLHEISFADMGVAITGFGSIISSIIVLPTIIAKHLFPENSETARFAFIKDNQKFDLQNGEGLTPYDNGADYDSES